MFIPVEDPSSGHQQHIWVVDKGKDGRLRKEMLHDVMYVPLTDAPN
jgi:protein-L-isoaspartate(D-aspartate) O-methyltransferase